MTACKTKDALAELDQALLRDRAWKRETGEVRRLQGELRQAISPEAWQVYLLLEAAANRRLARGLEVAVKGFKG